MTRKYPCHVAFHIAQTAIICSVLFERNIIERELHMPWSKKTEKIEVRLTHETKQNFLETCQQQGKSASFVIRELIEEYVNRLHIPILAKPIEIVRKTPVWGKLVGGALLTSSVALFALSSQATEPLQWEKRFLQKDSNNDKSLEWDEYRIKFKNEKNPEIARRAQLGADQIKIKEFDGMDSNDDELITKQEFRDFYMSRKREEFSGYDTDSDGFVTLAEFVSPQSREAEISYLLNVNIADARYSGRPHAGNYQMSDGETTATKVIFTPASVHFGRAGQVFRSTDRNDDGRLDFGEFIEIEY